MTLLIRVNFVEFESQTYILQIRLNRSDVVVTDLANLADLNKTVSNLHMYIHMYVLISM